MKLFQESFFTFVIIVLVSFQAQAETNLHQQSVIKDSAVISRRDVGKTVPFALTTSGGISLGSYQAGVNWAIIAIMKKMVKENVNSNYLNPDLAALTGASAGSINAVMTAINWCLDPEKVKTQPVTEDEKRLFENSIDENLLKDIWIKVGIEQLLPEKEDDYYDGRDGLPHDALFSRKKAFQGSITSFTEILKKDVFKNSCRVPIGVLATREVPPEIVVDRVKVKNQRVVFALEFFTDNSGGHFRSVKVDESDPDFGSVVYLPRKNNSKSGDYIIDNNDVAQLMYASSAFPLVFSKVLLNFCTSREGGKIAERCVDGNLMKANFIDGGVFDNIPLGTAKALSEQWPIKPGKQKDWWDNGVRHWYFFISPSNRRNFSEPGKDTLLDEPSTYGLKGLLSFLPGTLDTLGDYELYTLLRSGKWSRQSHAYSEKILGLLKQQNIANKYHPESIYTNSNSEAVERAFAEEEQHRIGLHTSAQTQLKSKCRAVDSTIDYITKTYKRLEYEYLPFEMFGGINRDDSVIKMRYNLLACLSDTATALDEQALAYSIRQSMLDRFGERKIVVSSRHFDVTGDFLGHFGAFLDAPLREFDYYAGIYDAVNDMSDFVCRGIDEKSETCLGKQAQEIFAKLKIGDSESGRTVFILLATHEHTDYEHASSPWSWVNNYLVQPGKQTRAETMAIIFRSLKSSSERFGGSDDNDKKFQKFVQNLHHNSYKSTNKTMQRIIDLSDDDVSSWYAPTISRLGSRLKQLQSEESKIDKNTTGWKMLAKGASFGLGKYFGYNDTLTAGPSTEPKDERYWKLIPYELNIDLVNGGFSVAYMPQLRLGNWSLDLKLTPAGYAYANFAPSRLGYSQIDLYASYHYRPMFVSLGAGPTVHCLWGPVHVPGFARVDRGVAGYFEFIRTFRFTFGARTAESARTTRNNFYMQLGIVDLPGLFSRLVN